MENIPAEVQLESIKSFQSTIRKSEKALVQMKGKGANTSLIEKRLKAHLVGLAVLEHLWRGEAHLYSKRELAEARDVLAGLLPSIEKLYGKSKESSPQRTLLERRIKSLELVIGEIDDLSDDEKI